MNQMTVIYHSSDFYNSLRVRINGKFNALRQRRSRYDRKGQGEHVDTLARLLEQLTNVKVTSSDGCRGEDFNIEAIPLMNSQEVMAMYNTLAVNNKFEPTIKHQLDAYKFYTELRKNS